MRGFWSILLARRTGGGARFAAFYLILILGWKCAMTWLVSPPLDQLERYVTLRGCYFWYNRGLTPTYISDYQMTESWQTGWLPYDKLLFPIVAPLLLAGLLGWLGYRWINRRPKPTWSRFVRHWWRACLYSTLIFPTTTLIAAIVPGMPLDPYVMTALGLGYVAYWAAVPAFFARREIAVRARRLFKRCPRCRYSLRAIQGDVCPECGTRVVHSRLGGYEIWHA
jgi:hypothetical protein